MLGQSPAFSGFSVDDVDKAVKFYTTHLGFKELTNFSPAFADVVRGKLRLQRAPLPQRGRVVATATRSDGIL